MTTVRLVVQPSRNPARMREALCQEPGPAFLALYHYLGAGLPGSGFVYRDWVLDSGAYTAHTQGAPIDLDKYTREARAMLDADPTLTEVFALDVIGDWRASRRNTERMWAQGVPAIPTYHLGSPWDVLVGLARDYPKIALGGSVGMQREARRRWFSQCFARVWPKRIHGLGVGTQELVNAVPFHSVDATSWQLRPAYGLWRGFGRRGGAAYVSVHGHKNLRIEVEWYLDLETRARALWGKEMAQLAALPPLPRVV